MFDIPLVMTYKDKGSKAALASLGKIEKSALSVGKVLGLTFSAAAITAFGKASVSAYLADEKAARSLSATLGNMGLAIESIQVENFIQNIQKTTGVLDDELRPAMQSLIIATNDVAKAQSLMTTALDIAATGQYDLNTLVTAFSKAAMGNLTALSKLNLGLTSAELKTKNFYDIQLKLSRLYAGEAAAAANTYAGKLAKLSAAYADVKEQVGKGLIDAFTNLTGNGGSIDDATNAMRNFGAIAQQEIYGLTIGIKQLASDIAETFPLAAWIVKKSIDGWNQALGVTKSFQQDIINSFAEIQKENTKKLEQDYKNLELQKALNKQIEKDRLKALREQNKQLYMKLALEKASAQLQKSSLLFNNEAIQLAAAAASKQTDEDYLRIEIKSEMLQLDEAIKNKDVEGATALAAKLKLDMARLDVMRAQNDTISMMKNPFESWAEYLKRVDLYLKSISDEVDKINRDAGKKISPVIPPVVPQNPNVKAPPPEYYTAPETLAQAGSVANDVNNILSEVNDIWAGLGFETNPTTGQTTIVNVNVAGSVLAEQDLAATIVEQLYVRQGNGTGIQYNSRVAI